MENVKQLRDELKEVFENLRDDKIEVPKAKTLVATSNAMLKSAQLELEHAKLTGYKEKIKFLVTEKES